MAKPKSKKYKGKPRRLSAKKQAKFLHNILSLAKANLTQKEVAQRLVEFGSKVEQRMGDAVLDSLTVGGTFAKGVEPWFTPMAWEALLAGEKIGNWGKGIENALKILEMTSGSNGGFGAFFKPIGMLAGGLGGLAGAYSSFFPKIEDLHAMSKWGSISKAAYDTGAWVTEWWLVLIITVVSIIAGTILTIKYATGPIRAKLDKLPIFRHYRLMLGANLLRSMGNLTLAGFGLKDTLKGLQKNSNKYQASHIEQALKNIGKGRKNVGDIMNTGLLDASEESTLKVLGEKGGYSQTMLNCADITQHKVTNEMALFIYVASNLLMLIASIFLFLLMGGVGILMFDLATGMG